MQPPKVFVTFSSNPSHNPEGRTISIHPFNHQLDILLPTPIYTLLSPTLPQQCPTLANPPSYRRLIIPLGAILESEFFNTHIKKGNIILISKGQLDTDDLFTLCDGVLRMILNNESYERAGIQGRPAQWGNGPGLAKRRRFVIELNLRSPLYLTGKPHFNKLLRACKEVFNKPITFLFSDIAGQASSTATDTTGPTITPSALSQSTPRPPRSSVTDMENLRVPGFVAPKDAVPHGGGKSATANYHREVWRDWAMEVYEYLALLLVPGGRGADRLSATDNVDSYLSVYGVGEQEDVKPTVGSVTRISVSGVLSKEWIAKAWGELKTALEQLDSNTKLKAWCAMTVHGFEGVPAGWSGKDRGGLGRSGDGYTVMKLPGQGGTMLYELVGGQEDYS